MGPQDSSTTTGAGRRILNGIGRGLAVLFGKPSWDAPPWARFIGGKVAAAGRWSLGHKGAASVLVLAIAGLGIGGRYGYRWYQNRPKPLTIEVSTSAPGLTPLDDPSRIDPLVIEFGGSAAPLKSIGKAVTPPITMKPKLEGAWKWDSDRRLVFTPKNDWPIGEDISLDLARKGLVSDDKLLSTYELKVKTPPFKAIFSEAEFYQDPIDPALKKVVATVRFTHAVDAAEFEKRIAMTLKARPSTGESDKPWKFKVSYDKWKGAAFLHSEPIPVPEKDTQFTVAIDKGVKAARGSEGTPEKLERTVKVPGLYNFFNVEQAQLTLVDNERYEPEQVLVVETSSGVEEKELAKNLQAWVLPLYTDDEEKKEKRPHNWDEQEDQVGQDVLAKAPQIKLEPIATEQEFATLHSFRYRAEVGRFIYVQVKKGVAAFGGYVLGETWDKNLQVPAYQKQLKILGTGSLLSLSGEKKVPVVARDVEAIRFEIGRVLPDQVQHLVSQSGGSIASPNFSWYQFGADNIVERFEEVRALTGAKPGKPQYPALDLSRYLDGGRRGLFLLKVESWNPQTNSPTGVSDNRMILLTDLGLLVKDAADGTHDVFVQSLHEGTPVSGAKIEVIGKNGIAVLDVTTDGDGHAKLPSYRELRREREPILYLARKGSDMSLLPIGRGDRYLDFSRFDIGGESDRGRPQGLSAYLFSDRGVYRPGDEIRVGLIVKGADWTQGLAGVPLEIVVTDARGLTVKKETIKLGAAGFEEIRHTTQETSPTGTYTVNVYVTKDGQPKSLLGSTSVIVREFLPDKMKIAVHLSTENPDGWVNPKDLAGRVTLTNLFGTPAEDRKVRGVLRMSAVLPSFGKHRDFKFYDAMHAKDAVFDSLAEVETDEKGEAELPLHLERFAAATYKLVLHAEGFEAEGGRGVGGEVSAIVSPLPFLVGYKADGDLSYVSRGARRHIELIAIDPQGAKTTAGVKAILVERKYVSVLTKQDNGTYKYESVKKEVPLSEKPLSVGQGGARWTVPSDKPGDFALLVRDEHDIDLHRIEFTVAGDANISRSLEKNAELQLALKKKDIGPGDEIEMQIKAPYVGAGLITVERDRVYAHKWFKTDTTASIQTIKLPDDFEGSGYVSVAFIRDIGSNEVFMSPLSYGVVPFSVSRERRTTKIEIDSPEIARPGEPYRIKYKTDRPAKIVVFAVDEGILRVARYETPDPLGFFFQKRALEVRSAQILDLILPEFSRLMAAAPGGDDEGALAANLNPFKRRRDKPVTYWSGILDAGPEAKQVEYVVPDYFSGTLRVMAVAVAPEAVGAFEKKSLVRGDFVISPNVPTFAAPGDEFDVGVGVSNLVAGSGDKAQVTLELQTSKHLTATSAKQTLTVGEMREGQASFHLKANDVLGSAELTFIASLGNKTGRLRTDLSVRPPIAYMTTLAAGHVRSGDAESKIGRSMHPEFRTLEASVSYVPLGLAHGLAKYLEKFPHGCTEQIVSQGMPAAVLSQRAEFGIQPEEARRQVQAVIDTLRGRQNDEGGFGLWASSPHTAGLPSVYAIHFLTEARERGFAVPSDLLKQGLGWLAQLAGTEGDSLADERMRAYAVYVLTRNGRVTTNFAAALQKRLENAHAKEWKSDLAGVYLAAVYKLLKQDGAARKILDEAKLGQPAAADYAAYYDPLIRDAQLLYVIARHFPDRVKLVTAAEIRDLLAPVLGGAYNTLSSAYTILALDAYATAASTQGEGKLSITELDGGAQKPLALPAGVLPRVTFGEGATALRFGNAGPLDAFWMVSLAGFDRAVPKEAIKQRMEVFREYTDGDGKPVTKVRLGDEIAVHVRLRAITGDIPNVAIIDLLPGGFEVVVKPREAPEENHDENNEGGGEGEGEGEGHEGGDEGSEGDSDDGPAHHEPEEATPFALPIAQDGTTFTLEYGDVREDRVVLYGAVPTDAKEFIYHAKAIATGTFTVPPIQAESLYDRGALARSAGGGTIVVEKK